jgi:benzoyl-CoA reductase/2-hydroxyglutaryl-CoA dehydratase subunit BcrC/BadD/HgdB
MTKKKRSSSKTLQTAREAGYFGKKMLASAKAASLEGRPTAWSMADWWVGSTIARAMGVEIVFPENYGAFCAAVGVAESNLDYAGNDGFASTLCGYARNCIGYTRKLKENNFFVPEDAPGGGMAKPAFLLACGVVCDTRYKWFQALGRYLDVPVWTVEIPQTGAAEYFLDGNIEANIKFMVKELREFILFLERILGKKMDWDILSERVDTLFKTHQLTHEVTLLRKAVPSPMVSTDFWSLMIPHLYIPDDIEALEFYKRVYKEVKHKVDNKIGAIPNEKYRIMFSELPPWHSLGFFDEVAEKHGIAFVIESWGYHVPAPLTDEETKGSADPLELLARHTYNKFHHAAPTARKYDTDPPIFMAPYIEWAADYKADGLMCHPLLSCRPATYTLMHLRNLLMQKFKVPSVVVEGDIVDLRVFNEDEAYAKTDAFVETMDYYREIRKKEGL